MQKRGGGRCSLFSQSVITPDQNSHSVDGVSHDDGPIKRRHTHLTSLLSSHPCKGGWCALIPWAKLSRRQGDLSG